jgi:RHS repeat-associated protein
LIQITYPGSGNYSQFAYDGPGRNVLIQEYSGATLSSTKQFVWFGAYKQEERDVGGSITKQFFGRGVVASGSSEFYTRDQQASIRELTDASGVIQAQYSYDPYGRIAKLQGASDADFGYAMLYRHSPSGLELANARAYNPALGRFINRDPIAEDGGNNLYRYTANSPVNIVDPFGLQNYGVQPGTSTSQPPFGGGPGSIEGAVGAPAGSFRNGCVDIDRFFLQIPLWSPLPYPTLPEQWPWANQHCYWGHAGDVKPAAKKCPRNHCDPGQHTVIWCKQGFLANPSDAGEPGSPVQSPNSIGWSGAGAFNYSIFLPETGAWVGADGAPDQGSCGRISPNAPDPYGNGSICCQTCQN